MKVRDKNTIPVYDICSLANARQIQEDIIAERFSDYLHRHPANLHQPHRHSFYHLVYFTKGNGTHTVDFETFPVKAGQIYFMIPGQVHSWHFKGNVDGFIVNFSAHMLDAYGRDGRAVEQFPFFNGNAADGVVQLRSTRHQVEALFATIIKEATSGDRYSTDLIRISLLSLFIYVARDIAPGKSTPLIKQSNITLQNFRRLLEKHFHTMRLPKDFAAMLFITPNHLNALCNELLGKPAGEIIRDRVLLEAKRLLVSSGVTVAEIATMLNFPDNSYFTKFFKKYAGTTPEDFRHAFIDTTKK